ncbi:MAG: HAMP domain-containing protein [Chitinophagaceae bacterium]|nr:HAMP domain-containing protein [Oligoflexus sp.]
MLERIPIRIRLSLGHALWMALLFSAIGWGVFRVVEDSVFQALDSTLLTSAKTLRNAQMSEADKKSAFKNPLYSESMIDEFFGGQRYVRAYAQQVDTSGKISARTNFRVFLPVTPLALSRADRGLETYETFHISSGSTLRQITLPVIRNAKFTGELIQVGASMSASMSTVNSVKSMLWISLSLGLSTSVLFGYLLLKWSFKPVARITHEVARMGFTDNFDRRLKMPRADDEMRLLVRTFNEMLGRIEDGFGRLRRFAGDVSHELRTPIAVLRGEAELSLRRERTGEEYRASLQTIVEESSQMSAIVEDLLLLARAQGQSIPIHPESVAIADLAHELEQGVRKNYEEKQVKLTLVLGDLGGYYLQIAKGYIVIAIKNILLNACKHSSAGQEVQLEVRETAKEIRFVVIDHGEGIPQTDMPYIFDLFYRADTARNRSSGGVGIGLSLAKALIHLHGGKIEVSATEGGGASFLVALPKEKLEQPLATPTMRQKIFSQGKSLSRWSRAIRLGRVKAGASSLPNLGSKESLPRP